MTYNTLEKFGDYPTDNKQRQMEWLINVLNFTTEEYDKSTPIISDSLWDKYYFMLVKLEQETGITLPNTPTQKIHYAIVSELPKVKHNHPMLSLNKTKDIKEIVKFIGKQPFICMGKMDGLTASLTYEDGKLVRAETRGDGAQGENIVHNAEVIPSIPKEIPNMVGKLVVDGEIICTYNDFKYFSRDYKNPRNLAAGSIRLLDANECVKRRLTFIAWDVIAGLEKTTTLSERLELLRDQFGFTIVPFKASEQWYEFIVDEVKSKCKEEEYPIDGLVFKYDDCEYYKKQGRTEHHFRGGLALKDYDETTVTKLQDISWQVGRSNVLTPVAIFDPVEIEGTRVSRSTLHNLSIMKGLYCKRWYKGLNLSVYKANLINPQVEAVWDDDDLRDAEFLDVPTECPYCGKPTTVEKTNDAERLYCTNINCVSVQVEKIAHFASKKCLDIKGLSQITIQKLYNEGYCTSVKDIFDKLLNTDIQKSWAKMEGFGPKSVNKIVTAIEEARMHCTLESFISAIGIPLIGKSVAKEITKVFPSYEEFRDAVDKKYNFGSIPTFAERKTKEILSFDYSEADYIFENYITIEQPAPVQKVTSTLDGLTVCITGKLHSMKNRTEFKSLIEAAGGKVVDSVTKKVNYLINNDVTSTSSKNKKAKELNIEIISEEDFIKKFGLENSENF